MKELSTLPLLLAAATALLCSCAVVQRQAVFRESDFAWSGGAGSGAGIGRSILLKGEDPSLAFWPNTAISIVPVNEYTTEIVHSTLSHAGDMLTPAPDPLYSRYVRITRADQQGRFAFHNLPPGDYYLMATVEVDHTITVYNSDTGGNDLSVERMVTPIHARVFVRNGQTVQVANWNG